jgi:hypothetical protein
VLALICVYYLRSRPIVVGTQHRRNDTLHITLLVALACIFGLSLENTVRSANNGSEIGLILGLVFALLTSGCIIVYLYESDEYFSSTRSRKWQVCIIWASLKQQIFR